MVTLIDHQPQMLFGVSSIDRQTLINNTIGLAKAAKLCKVPMVLSTVETKSFSGYLWPQLVAVYPDQKPIERSSMNAWEDTNYVAAIERTGRKTFLVDLDPRREPDLSLDLQGRLDAQLLLRLLADGDHIARLALVRGDASPFRRSP